MVSRKTPPEVIDAMNTIANYLREGGWAEVVISECGGAAFHVEIVYDWLSDEGKRRYAKESRAIRWEEKEVREEMYTISRVGNRWTVKDKKGDLLGSLDTRREAETFVSALHEWEPWALLYVHVVGA